MVIKLEEICNLTTCERIVETLRAILIKAQTGERIIVEVKIGESENIHKARVYSRTAPKLRTRLSQFVREARGHLTQEAFQKMLRIKKPQYVSRIERGMIGTPDEHFFAALAKHSKKSVGELKQMSQEVL